MFFFSGTCKKSDTECSFKHDPAFKINYLKLVKDARQKSIADEIKLFKKLVADQKNNKEVTDFIGEQKPKQIKKVEHPIIKPKVIE